jgi:hypothetical protein
MNQRIIVKNDDGSIGIIIPSGSVSIEDVLKKDVPKGLEAEIVSVGKIPTDRTFREAWAYDKTKKISFNIDKCKEIAHGLRRASRGKEFAPHDEIIAKQIPGADMAAAESARNAIRSKYENMQSDIDNCSNEVEIKSIIDNQMI